MPYGATVPTELDLPWSDLAGRPLNALASKFLLVA